MNRSVPVHEIEEEHELSLNRCHVRILKAKAFATSGNAGISGGDTLLHSYMGPGFVPPLLQVKEFNGQLLQTIIRPIFMLKQTQPHLTTL